MRRFWQRLPGFVAGAFLLAVIAGLPARAADPEPGFEYSLPAEVATANVTGMRVAPDGRLWILDSGYGQLIKWNRDCTQTPSDNCADYYDALTFGEGGGGYTLAIYDDDADPQTYRVYVTEPGWGRVSVFDQDGLFLFAFGEPAPGIPEGLNRPTGITVDSEGDVYVADRNNNRIEVFDSDGEWLATWPHEFYELGGLFYDAAEDRIYVVSRDFYGYRVNLEAFQPNETFIDSWLIGNWNSVPGDLTKSGDYVFMADNFFEGGVWRKDVSTSDDDSEFLQGGIHFPGGLAVIDEGGPNVALIVGDQSGILKRYTPILGALGTFNPALTTRYGTRGDAAGYFDLATGITERNGIVYVVDARNFRIQLFNAADGAFITQWVSPWADEEWPAAEPWFPGPQGITTDPDGGVYVADPEADRFIYFPPGYVEGEGTPILVVEKGDQFTFLQRPFDIATDGQFIYVTEFYTGRVEIFEKLVDVPTSPDDFAYLGGWTAGATPAGIAYNPIDQRFYVADPEMNQVHVYRLIDEFPPVFEGSLFSPGSGPGQMFYPTDVTLDDVGNLWVLDNGNNRVQVFSLSFEPEPVASHKGTVGKRGGAAEQFFWPESLFHSGDRLYVADTGSHRFQVFLGDADDDGVTDDIDNCPDVFNPGQFDLDEDGVGDGCDPDDDGDGIEDELDNCQFHPNPGQEDMDEDGIGDLCDPDIDGDGIENDIDNCPSHHNPGQEDWNDNNIGDACDDEPTPTPSPTATSTSTVTATATSTNTPTAFETPATATPTAISTATPVPSATATSTAVPAATATSTGTPSAAFNPPTAAPAVNTTTSTPSPVATTTGTPLATQTPAPAATNTPQLANTPVILPNTGGIPQLATETPASSPTPGTTPTLGTTPTPGASPTAAATATAPAGTSPTPAVTPTPEDRPQLFSEVLDAREISFAPETIAANMALSLVLVLLLIDVSLFNTTIKENEGVILGLFGGLFAPLKKVQDAWTKEDGETIFSRLLKPALVLGTSALIYCLLEPNLTVDRSSLILFLSLVLGIGIATYVYEGAQVFVSEKMFGLDAAIRFYPIAILISLLSVLFSKLTGLHPGVIFGFVAGAALVAHRNPEKHEDGLIIFLPMLAIFAVALVSWLLLSPIREMAEGGSFVGLVLEGAALSLFLGGIQGLLFSLIPLSFVDGEKVWRWSKLAWAAIAFPVGFLFFHVVVKQDGTLMSAIDSHGVTVLFIVAAVSWTITIGTWLFFKLTQGKAAA